MRHCVVVLLAVALTALFLEVHSKWAPMHRWNRAFADASLVLLSMTMMVGPAVVFRRAWARIVPWRRELGIYSVVFGALHFVVVFDGWLAWDIPRMFGLLVHPLRGERVMVEHGFGLANVLGLAALAYAATLVAVSNDYAVRRLGGGVWKFIQRSAYVLWLLVVMHTAYFLFMHFLHFDRPLPEPNPLQLPFAVLVGAVFALRWAAAVRTWRMRQRDSADATA